MNKLTDTHHNTDLPAIKNGFCNLTDTLSTGLRYLKKPQKNDQLCIKQEEIPGIAFLVKIVFISIHTKGHHSRHGVLKFESFCNVFLSSVSQ